MPGSFFTGDLQLYKEESLVNFAIFLRTPLLLLFIAKIDMIYVFWSKYTNIDTTHIIFEIRRVF